MFKRFIHYYKPHKVIFILDMIAAFLVAAIGMGYPILTRYILNDVVPSTEMLLDDKWVAIAVAGVSLLAIYLFRMFLRHFIQYYGHVMGVRMQGEMRTDLFNKLQNKNIPIKVALLDQAIINGIGNIYASEALFDAELNPTRAANSLNIRDCERLVDSIRKILKQAIDAGGSSIHDYRKPDGSLGYFQNMHCVYNKIGQKCPGCTCNITKTGGIRKIVQTGRSTFYCPVKQK